MVIVFLASPFWPLRAAVVRITRLMEKVTGKKAAPYLVGRRAWLLVTMLVTAFRLAVAFASTGRLLEKVATWA